ncbi:aspartate/glutamate racemase family protein [Ramlibacter agri]|uniref:aspartate/glutamate racemase family protein n=1 Tax=Ramlibacter agri TaxID=2728837 RepID=UPI00198034B5
MSRSLLVINPNTTEAVTVLLREHLMRAAGPDIKVHAVTARFGAPYIADEASYAVGGHATLDAWTTGTAVAPDAVLIGCFGDPGLFALRECTSVPVTGLAEASFVEASRHGRFAIVTGGAKWEAMLRRLALATGFAQALAGIVTVAPTGAQLAADPQGARDLLTQACQEAAVRFEAQAVIVGGAALAGYAALMQADVGVPLIDSVAAGARWALRATHPLRASGSDRTAPPPR